jgi:hypothetical protein
MSRSRPVAADSHDRIRVHGARENNLKDVSIEIPKRRLTRPKCPPPRAERSLRPSQPTAD